MDRVSNNRSLALASPGANNRMLEEGPNNINALRKVSGGTLHRSSASSNISVINSPEQQPPSQHHPNKLQRTPSHLKSGQAAQNGPHHRTWAHSRRPRHYSDSSSVYSAFADHNYESIDGDASSVDRLSDVPPPPAPPQSEVLLWRPVRHEPVLLIQLRLRPVGLARHATAGKVPGHTPGTRHAGLCKGLRHVFARNSALWYGAAGALWLRPTQARHGWLQWASLLTQDAVRGCPGAEARRRPDKLLLGLRHGRRQRGLLGHITDAAGLVARPCGEQPCGGGGVGR
ncbi:uncharacterized protein LOC119433465 isoform X1 [Dermacentor silvarum]|uniref:uncharacterized protein LOC119433465 isoform X1 n=1 Tax=Dermacentor silvarum TaxID=543639 RepID=UPI001899EB04|nr:uncharacterized protein LOC119433465 isoform X1 [Dermacentor silvarum]XP_049514692.1 uncharacterized protein LOC119433465 isoform X1 [Dermacentor silvarum]